jgi:glycosyltransferase involved in cell wall biosynthesis
MFAYNLSYILTTYNKLDYLKIVLPLLIENCSEDEEIVITDAGSSDGTSEYLIELYNQKKIHQFISEKDFGESHGTNKAILLAKGQLIKIITDDDLFHYPTIKLAKQKMLLDGSIDVIGFDGFGYNMDSATANKRNVWKTYLEWKSNKKPFIFSGLSIIFKKSCLPYIGMLNSTQKAIDFEFTLRITALKQINFAWIKNWGFINVANSSSNSNKFHKEIYLDGVANIFYYQFRDRIKYTIKRNIVFALSTFIKKEDEKERVEIDMSETDMAGIYLTLNNYLYAVENTNQLL